MQTILSQVTSLHARYRRASRPLLLLSIVLPWLLFGAFALSDYRGHTEGAREQIGATTDALAEHAQTVVETADLALARVLDHVQDQDWQTIAGSAETHDFLLSLKQELPQLESVFLVSPAGINVASSRGFPLPPISDADRDYFQAALQGDQQRYISAPFVGQLAGTSAFTVTRPRLRDGRFDGLAGVTISPKYFAAFYRAMLAYPGQSSVSLLRDDGTVLVRVPEAARPLARLPSDGALMRKAVTGARSGLLEAASTNDLPERLVGFRRLQGWPLMVAYAVDRSAYLHSWYTHVFLFGLSTVLLTVALLFAGRVMLHRAAQEQDALRRLIEETERRQQAEAALLQAQKLEALGRLTGGVAHDFNNLLAAVLGSLELLEKHVTGERPLRFLATARQAAERGARLTAQMLAFARRKEVTVRPVDVASTVHGMHDLLLRAIGPEVRITYDVPHSLGFAMADAGQLEIALLNLAVNARDAMPMGGELRFTAREVMIDAAVDHINDLVSGSYVRISIRDTGEGMTEAVRARIFEPFFTTKGPGKGTGLGLAMVFGFASLVGGTVTVESQVGAGTTITLYLPSTHAPSGAAEPLPTFTTGAIAPSPNHAMPRILLVDDDRDVRSTAQVMLEGVASRIETADSGEAALRILRADRGFDLLVIDFTMPGMNGSELATEIRKLWPEAPLLFVTGYVENDALRPWQELGILTLNKPYTQAELAAAIEHAIDRSGATARLIPLRVQGGQGH
jgi:two-component system NtrC family sensor kinase